MNFSPQNASKRPRVIFAAIAIAVLTAAVAATAFGANARVIGKTARTPQPNCPGTAVHDCQVMGQVTGFQRSVDGRKSLFKVRENGKIVAWSVDLARPSGDEIDIFEEAGGAQRYGNGPTAGIAVLRKGADRKFKLVRKSPIVKVKGYLGQRPVFTLEDPLRVRRGQIIAVTTATWLPNFAAKNLSAQNVWVASRQPDECGAGSVEEFFEQSAPHLKEGSERRYGCVYNRARLLYWAYFVPAPGGGGGN